MPIANLVCVRSKRYFSLFVFRLCRFLRFLYSYFSRFFSSFKKNPIFFRYKFPKSLEFPILAPSSSSKSYQKSIGKELSTARMKDSIRSKWSSIGSVIINRYRYSNGTSIHHSNCTIYIDQIGSISIDSLIISVEWALGPAQRVARFGPGI